MLPAWLKKDVVRVAPRLLGCYLQRTMAGTKLMGKIVETEAYHQDDAASHSYRGQTQRTEVMFGPEGRAYVYFTYGMHYCFNIVTGTAGEGSAVLIRALEPTDGIELMKRNRKVKELHNLSNGPAKLCYALVIDRKFNGHKLSQPPLELLAGKPIPKSQIIQSARIGISRETAKPWRWYLKDNPFVSKT